MTTLIQRLRAMADDDGVRAVQLLLDEVASAHSVAGMLSQQNLKFRAALRHLLDAKTDQEVTCAQREARAFLDALPPLPVHGAREEVPAHAAADGQEKGHRDSGLST